MTPFYDGVIKKVLSLNYELIVFFTKKTQRKVFESDKLNLCTCISTKDLLGQLSFDGY